MYGTSTNRLAGSVSCLQKISSASPRSQFFSYLQSTPSRSAGTSARSPQEELRQSREEMSKEAPKGQCKVLEKSQEPTEARSGERVSTQAVKQSELDEQLRLRMAGLAGDGDAAGLELEDGKPVSMKRSVKNNMFRYI